VGFQPFPQHRNKRDRSPASIGLCQVLDNRVPYCASNIDLIPVDVASLQSPQFRPTQASERCRSHYGPSGLGKHFHHCHNFFGCVRVGTFAGCAFGNGDIAHRICVAQSSRHRIFAEHRLHETWRPGSRNFNFRYPKLWSQSRPIGGFTFLR